MVLVPSVLSKQKYQAHQLYILIIGAALGLLSAMMYVAVCTIVVVCCCVVDLAVVSVTFLSLVTIFCVVNFLEFLVVPVPFIFFGR